jgi:hypothetical protein
VRFAPSCLFSIHELTESAIRNKRLPARWTFRMSF